MLKILGIETSCDETSVAVVTEDKKILSLETISQSREHAGTGGVVPEVASRSHMKNIDGVVARAMEKAGIELKDIDAIAVTSGPGLMGGLMVGVVYAKALASALDKPIIAVNHLAGHALTIRLTSEAEYPFLVLLVSGGNTQFQVVKGADSYIKLGQTLDDALGEAFDKIAKMLGLGYPGGPVIEQRAKLGDDHAYKFPRPMFDASCDFSFSGLKSAVLRQVDKLTLFPRHPERSERISCNDVQKGQKSKRHEILSDLRSSERRTTLNRQDVNNICASFQRVAAEVLERKVMNAVKKSEQVLGHIPKTFVLSGGVAANVYIRERLEELCDNLGVKFLTPPINLCGDNAAMIAWTGIERYKRGLVDDLSFPPRARWKLS